MPTLQAAHDMARFLVGEWQTPEVFTDDHLLEFSPGVYREIQRRFAEKGHALSKTYINFDVGAGATDSSASVAFPASTIIKPLRLWEGANGSTLLSAFTPMEEAWPELQPRAQTAVLSHWEWKDRKLWFVGSSAARTVRMHYAKYLADLTVVGDNLLIPDCVEAMAYGTAGAAAGSRGGDERALNLEKMFDAIVERMMGSDTARMTGS